MTLTMFLVLAGYYLLKTARELFILSEGGAEVKSYSSAGQALLLLVIVPAYGAFASRVNRMQLIQWVTLFFAANLVLFVLALSAGLRIGVVFFIWLGIFNVMVIAQFWAFANDLYTEEQGKRLFPLIGVGSSLGRLGGLDARRAARRVVRARTAAGRRRRSSSCSASCSCGWSTESARDRNAVQAARSTEKLAGRPERLRDDPVGSLSAAHRGARRCC